MTVTSPLLPPAFADLERYTGWALPTEPERLRKRLATPMADIRAFYDALLPRAAAALEYLDGFPLDGLDGPQARLMHLLLSLAEVSVAVELYGQPDHPFGLEMTRFVAGSAEQGQVSP